MESIRALLTGSIDYAGLFPPAALDMPTAVRNYLEYRDGNDRWALGRFVLPASRFDEYKRAAAELMIPLSLLIAPGQSFSFAATGIESIETKVEDAAGIQPSSLPMYYEIPIGSAAALAPILAQTGARAKVRTGGLVESAFPGTRELAQFLGECARAGVPFKATAGLHHPIRAKHRLTYEADSGTAMMHGFINVFVAAAFIYTGGTEEDAAAALEETDARAFEFNNDAVRWRDRRLTNEQLRLARERFAISFGSCSFEEPMKELRVLEWL
jgi:hypothetical protein